MYGRTFGGWAVVFLIFVLFFLLVPGYVGGCVEELGPAWADI